MTIQIIPQPVQLREQTGVFALERDFAIFGEDEALPNAALLQKILTGATEKAVPLNPPAPSAETARIELRLDAALSSLGDEGYRLSVSPQRILLSAPKPAGLFYAVQTLRQMFPLRGAVSIPCVEIEDYPRFGWRGGMLDCCRYFFNLNDVMRFIDLLARHKLNRFHWHLTNDQGWRLEIKRYPRLTEVGAWRDETLIGRYDWKAQYQPSDGIPHGGFYTQEQVRQVLAFAAERHVTVVPEVEMPGHAQAAIAAYPELGNLDHPIGVSTTWGIHENVFNVRESTIQFLQNVLDEVLELFPSQIIHIGGDECPKVQWKQSAEAQARIKELGLKDEDELQSYFVRRMDTYLTERGRRLLGWDEILEGGLAPGAIVMSWRGEAGGIAAATMGHDVVMAPNTYAYLDYMQSADTAQEPLGIGGFLPLEKVYSFEPVPSQIPADKAHHILGPQGNLWAEYISARDHLEYMMFPRLCAIAEVGWTPAERKDYADFTRRLREAHLPRLDEIGVKYRPLD